MCSILLTNKDIKNFHDVNFYNSHRGPDYTSIYRSNGVLFVHNLLSICGEVTKQPFIDDGIVAMHNGEIYNYDDYLYKSDGYILIPSYKRFGEKFTKFFDGEFAVVLADFKKNIILFSTDIFKTKPLWLAIEGKSYGFSSYRTPLEKLGFKDVKPVPPNSIFKMNLNTMKIEKISNVYDFDLNQHKTNFNDWNKAFENSIRKRTEKNREKIFIGLSSGYDSGAIACELAKQKVNFTTYTVVGKENADVLQKRLKSNARLIYPTAEVYTSAHNHIMKNVESFKYTISSSSSNYNEFNLDVREDSGTNGLSMVCSRAKNDGNKILLSGCGADEIFSDYGFAGQKIYPHSNFGGLFPEDLTKIFPWNSFYGSSMESYLAKEEYVAGSYGIEARYPFLDKNVVQEFLWLTANLKNSEYKSVLDNYLTSNNYPFAKHQKLGF